MQEIIEAEPGRLTDFGGEHPGEMARAHRRPASQLIDGVRAPGQYVERIRTEAARRQLQETDDTVVTIAARCECVPRTGRAPHRFRR
ncbi:hypothetical protein MAHJHV60_45490 [Mycobacterium avium subsp. hominissuis]